MARIVAVDVGGTFTDVVTFRPEGLAGSKVSTTRDQAEGVISAVDGRGDDLFLHGTTVATNSLLEGSGAVVALVTDEGFEDLIEIARQDRPSLYDSGADRPPPLVERSRRLPSTRGLGALTEDISASGAGIAVVGLLDSYADPSREMRLAEELRDRTGLQVLAASDISPEFREYERLATATLSAYLAPSVGGYLGALDSGLPISRRLVMTSAGGLMPFDEAAGAAGRLLLSGPAGGVVAAAALASAHGHEQAISFDMGGTSTDVCRIGGGREATGAGHMVAGRVNRVPAIPVRTIGAGGGSVVWVDSGGALRVGPRSAGAHPGPAAYGRGGAEATVTDANIVAGNIPSDLSLGDEIELDIEAARAVLGDLGASIGLKAEPAARGVLDVVDSHMERALRAVSVEEGADPRRGVLVAFGGAGGLHASRLARQLGIGKVLVPPLSGLFSALGLLMARPRADEVRTVMLDEGDNRLAFEVRRIREEVEDRYQRVFGTSPAELTPTADVRYLGQSHELEVGAGEAWRDCRDRFESEHLERFGFHRPGEPIEVVNVRAAATGPPPLTWDQLPGIAPTSAPVCRGGAWRRNTLPAGFTLDGPALVVEASSAVLVEDGDHLLVHRDGTLEITAA